MLLQGSAVSNIYNLKASAYSQYRFVSFYGDREDFVTIQTDRVIAANETADPVMEMIVRVVQILDGAYPRIMKAIWS